MRKGISIFSIAEFFSKFEKYFLRLGAVFGVISAVYTFYGQSINPRVPDLEVEFIVSNSDTANYAQEVQPDTQKLTDPFPFAIRIKNTGTLTAEGVVLTMIFDTGDITSIDTFKNEPRYIFDGERVENARRVFIGDVNAKDAIDISKEIKMRAFNFYQASIVAVSNSGEKTPVNRLKMTQSIEIRITGRNFDEKISHLYLTTGTEQTFLKEKQNYFTYNDGRIIIHTSTARRAQ